MTPRLPDGIATNGEVAGKPAWPLAEVSRRSLAELVTGKSVRLFYGAIRKDRYGRRLAQAVLLPEKTAARQAPSGPAAGPAAAPIWLQAFLVGNGLARAYALPGVETCLATLTMIENGAIEAAAGLWGNAAYQMRSAKLAGALMRYRATYQIVEGRVRRVSGAKSRVYLNFGSDWREDFTVSVERRYLREFAKRGLDVKALRGRVLRVRGWITIRNGLLINVTNAGQIEVLD